MNLDKFSSARLSTCIHQPQKVPLDPIGNSKHTKSRIIVDNMQVLDMKKKVAEYYDSYHEDSVEYWRLIQ